MTSDRKAIPHTFWCTTRWADLDAQGHVNNVKFIQYIQEAIFDLIGQEEHVGILPDGFIVARHEVDYRRQLFHRTGHQLPLQIWIATIGTRSFTVRTETRRGGETVFEARTVCVARDSTTGASRELTTDEHRHLARYQLLDPTTHGNPRNTERLTTPPPRLAALHR